MARLKILSATGLGASLIVSVLAVNCPAVEVQAYGSNDQSCGGSSIIQTMYNNTCSFVNDGFSSVHSGRPTDSSWNNHCLVYTIVAQSCNGSFPLTSLFTAWNGSSEFDPTCKDTATTNYYGNVTYIPTAFYMICSSDYGLSNCNGPPNGTPTSISTTTTMTTSPNRTPISTFSTSAKITLSNGTPTTSTSTTFVKSTSSNGTPTPSLTTTAATTTPSPTNTRVANPFVISAVSSASSAMKQANSSVSAYQADPTNSAAAQSAEDAIESAMAYHQVASNIASDYQASIVVSHLSSAYTALTNAAVAAVAAESAPDAAAAAAVADAFTPVAAAIAIAVAAAARPFDDPAPDITTSPTSRTTSTSSTGPCTLNIESADADLPEPSPTQADPSQDSDSRITSTSAAAIVKRIGEAALDLELTMINVANDATEINEFHAFEKRANGRIAYICDGNYSFIAPDYSSWSSTGGNSYSPYYNYYLAGDCGEWDFKLVSSNSATLPPAPAGHAYSSQEYATEHIFEIQSVSKFLKHARNNEPIFQRLYAGSKTAFCRDFGRKLNSKNQFAASGVYNYQISPGQQIYNALEGGTGDASEFVYLQNKLNNRKAKFFGLSMPDGFNVYQDELAAVTRSAMVAQYLQNDNVRSIYRKVSDRVRQQFINFGQACNSSAQVGYNRFGNISWARIYDEWENSYIDQVGGLIYSTFRLALPSHLGVLKLRKTASANLLRMEPDSKR